MTPRQANSHTFARNVLSVTKITHLGDTHRRERLVNCKCYTSELGYRAISRALPRKVLGMRRTVVLMASMALTLLLASGVALAINEIRCRGGECNGTPRNDKMLGTPKRDIMYGFKGDDRLFGRDASDDLYGFGGSDKANGGDGSDKLGGSDGRDSLDGGMGPDFLNGGDNPDDLDGGPGNDEIFGGPGRYSDTFYNWDGNGGDDLLDGGGGEDWYIFWYSFSRPNAGWGHATISDSDIDPSPDQAVSAGDKLDFEIWWRDLTIRLSPGPGPEVTDNNGNSTIQWSAPGEIYSVFGGEGDDVITGDRWANRLMGSEGSDTISGGGGNDVLYSNSNLCCGDYDRSGSIGGGSGNDLIIVDSYETGSGVTSRAEGGAGDDNIRAQNGSPDTIDCGDGADTVTFDAGMDTVTNCEP
jgi:Ca2+-binding RTX toxin-like protein